VKYDVETGQPLRLANELLIDIPDCFKNGAPFWIALIILSILLA